MVRLKNIVTNGIFLECDIFPEDSKEPGLLKVDRENGNMVSYKLPKGYEYCLNHVYHARRALFDLYKKNDVTEEKTIMWN
jgi:hypothetical protein